MSKSDLNGKCSQCRRFGLLYCSVTHHAAGNSACHTEMVNGQAFVYLILTPFSRMCFPKKCTVCLNFVVHLVIFPKYLAVISRHSIILIFVIIWLVNIAVT